MSRRMKAAMSSDGVDRRGFLECMAWAGTGMLWNFSGGALASRELGPEAARSMGEFSFVQISDSHIGFSKEANKDVVGTLERTIEKINSLPERPDFLIHTGDLSHLAKADEFATLDEVLKSAKCGGMFFVPGEHDVLGDGGRQFLERYGKQTKGSGWYSFNHRGAHFVGLVNVMDLRAGGLGTLGADQLSWLADDLKSIGPSTPLVIFAHIPLWSVYPEWGWGTDDGAQALGLMKRFGSVTVLNGHIHQTMQKIEGNVKFHTAMSTAFPQAAPGSAGSPGPMKVPAERLADLLGITEVSYVPGQQTLAIVDSTLQGQTGELITIDNFVFSPGTISIRPGTKVTWRNRDDMPHVIASETNAFTSPVLDSDQEFSFAFKQAGSFPYFCKLHPKMVGRVTVA